MTLARFQLAAQSEVLGRRSPRARQHFVTKLVSAKEMRPASFQIDISRGCFGVTTPRSQPKILLQEPELISKSLTAYKILIWYLENRAQFDLSHHLRHQKQVNVIFHACLEASQLNRMLISLAYSDNFVTQSIGQSFCRAVQFFRV
jgi:hypothetical protein